MVSGIDAHRSASPSHNAVRTPNHWRTTLRNLTRFLRTLLVSLGAVALVASFTTVPAGADEHQKTIDDPNGVTDHGCNADEWHFVITQIGDEVTAPETIEIQFDSGSATSESVRMTGQVAHYTTTANLDGEVVGATATIDSEWSGQFNLSHGPCTEDVGTQPSEGEDDEGGDNGEVPGANPGEGQNPDEGQNPGDQGPADKVTLCHATGSESNPFVVITISQNAVFSQAHPEHQGGEDRIPAFEGFEGQNFEGLSEESLTAEQCAGDDGGEGDGPPSEGEGPGNGEGPGDGDQVSLCHATGSETNPFEFITVSESAVLDEAGHDGHENDIIPAFGDYPGQNLEEIEGTLTAEDCPIGTDGNGDGNGGTPPVGETPDGDEDVEVIDETDEVEETTDVEGDEQVADESDEVQETTEVRGDQEQNEAPQSHSAPQADEDERDDAVVLGSQVNRTALPRTGADSTVVLALAGFLMLALGFGLQRMGARAQAHS